MGIHNLDRQHLAYHQACIGRLTAESSPAWGKLTPDRLCAHLAFFIRMSLNEEGELKAVVPRPLQALLRWMFFEVFTSWPKGLKAPAFMTPAPQADFERERDELLAAMERFVDALDADPGRLGFSPAFGQNPLSYWVRLHGVHMNHHYRQFGLLPPA